MERTESNDALWQQVVAMQNELEQSMITLPALVDREFRPRRASPRAVRFAQALAFDVAWSGISDARERRLTRAIH